VELATRESSLYIFDEGFNTSATNKEKAWLATSVDIQKR